MKDNDNKVFYRLILHLQSNTTNHTPSFYRHCPNGWANNAIVSVPYQQVRYFYPKSNDQKKQGALTGESGGYADHQKGCDR